MVEALELAKAEEIPGETEESNVRWSMRRRVFGVEQGHCSSYDSC